ncbi:MAG: response regulator [Leptolyngbya sp. BL-A-14]
MSIPEIDSSQRFEAIADEQLQQELRGLFVVDTQHYLQKYSQIAESLQPQTWRSDVQELYRCVHTIKGGAVTIGADAVLHVATALEDVLADLRYLELAPNLIDNHLSQALLEAGELLTGSMEPRSQSEGQEPILNRIHTLHQEIRERYLPQWNEASQLHQSFATEGLDLVVLELDIALERLPEQGTVPDSAFHTAQQVLTQLAQIGEELQLADGWAELLQYAQPLLAHRDNVVWRSQWPLLFLALKSCAKQSGKPVPFELGDLQPARSLSANGLLTAPEANGTNGWVREPAADVNIDHVVRSDTDEAESAESDSVLDYLEQADTFAHIGTLLDALNPVAVISDAEGIENQVDWLVAPPFDETSSLPDWDGSLGERSLVDDRPHLDEASVPEHQADPLKSESEQDWLANTFLDALGATEATPVSPEIDFLDNAISFEALATEEDATKDVATEAGEAYSLVEHDLSDDRAPTLDFASQPDGLLDAESVLDWLDESIPSEEAAASRTPTDEQERALKGSPSPNPVDADQKAASPKPERAIESLERVQIPVPLETLDQSAHHLVETLLSLRTTQGFYQALQSQITQIMALAQEGTQYITHLRQIQDDYTLLEELSHNAQAATGPTPERYRQGYTVINRLLETSLRLSEIGAETGKTTQQISEYLQNVDRNVLKLQSTIEDSRLVPFQNLSFRAKAILRDLITRYNKPAKLLVQGEKTELDVTIARNLEPALLHLIRNAYDHGLESPSERTANGKPAQGTITLSLQRQGNRFQFEIRDDGRGIDANAIQARAEALGLPLCRTQTPTELLAVICQPGFSAQSQVSEISGRGVGMDVVAAQVARLGGRLSLDTVPGKGTTFQLQFPVPRLLVPCVLLRVGDQTLAIPEDDIRTITLSSDLKVSPVEGTSHAYAWTIQTDAGTLPALDLLKYWQPRTVDRALTDTTVCLYIALTGTQTGVWLLADELLEQAELIINPIPQPLSAPNGFIGVSLQRNGSLVPVLEARSLAEQLLAASTPNPETDSIVPSDANDSYEDYQTQSILIVDDAALMRRRLEASLNSNGYLTHTCADGQEAWHWLQTNPHPDLVITDIEMPNMDGFTLVDRCRQAGIEVPILVVSSRLSEEWFDEARRLGANDYLTKGFSTVDLLKKVNALLNLFVH